MVCPVMNKRPQAEVTSEYPYKPIYRPWSWILSSFTNLILFAALVGLLWMLYKRKKARGKRRVVTYRRVDVNKTLLAEPEDSTKINALVTGGSGVLGKEIVGCLVKDGGYKVHSLDLLIPEEENRNSEVCSYIQTDITNLDDLQIAMKGMDVVFHTAAILPTVLSARNSDFDEVNLKGTENIIAACKECKVKRLIYTSTIAVVAGKGGAAFENADEDYPFPKEPLNAYVRTKQGAEKAVLAANGEGGLTTCAVRPGGILDSIIRSRLDRLIYFGKKGLFTSVVSCDDLANVHLQLDRVLSHQSEVAAGKAFIICSTVSGREMSESIARELGGDHRAESVSVGLVSLLAYINVVCYFLTGAAPVSPRMTIMALDFLRLPPHTFSSARAERVLGWKPKPWEDTIKKLVKEWKENKKDN